MDCATYICEGIMIEILARKPAKSLLRFMAVCRLWKSIITSPHFRLLIKRPSKLLVLSDQDCYSLLEDDEEGNRLVYETDIPLKHDDRAEVIGSDNGLLCIGMIPNGEDYYNRSIIWNPFVRKHVVILDKPKEDNNIPYTFYIQWAYGFGGTISGNDYKYVRLVELFDGEKSFKEAVDIYSLKAGRWRRKYMDNWGITLAVSYLFPSSALLRGRLHWSYRDQGTNQIFSFDLEDEVFEDIITLPESIQSNIMEVNVTVIRESLAVIANEIERRHSVVWVMEDYGDVKTWNKWFNIDLNKEKLYENVKCKMVHLLKNGELLLGLLKREYPVKPKQVAYNRETMKTCDVGGGSSSMRGFTNYYKESLVLLGDEYQADADQQIIIH